MTDDICKVMRGHCITLPLQTTIRYKLKQGDFLQVKYEKDGIKLIPVEMVRRSRK